MFLFKSKMPTLSSCQHIFSVTNSLLDWEELHFFHNVHAAVCFVEDVLSDQRKKLQVITSSPEKDRLLDNQNDEVIIHGTTAQI